MSGGARVLRHLAPSRHARTRSTAVRFRWAGPGERGWYRRVSGPSAGSGHGSRPARTRRPFPPVVTPDLIRGPGPQAPPSPGFPRAGVRDEPGPRIKSGVTTGGRRRPLSWARNPRRKAKSDSSGLVPGMTREGRTENRKRPKNDLKEKISLDPGRVRYHISHSGVVGAPEGSAPLCVAGHTARHVEDTIVHHATAIVTDMPTRGPNMPTPGAARAVGICRPKCRPAGRVGKCRHSRPAFAERECRPGSDLPTRCLCRRREPAPSPGDAKPAPPGNDVSRGSGFCHLWSVLKAMDKSTSLSFVSRETKVSTIDLCFT